MFIYHLTRRGYDNGPTHDAADEFAVVANDESEARRLAARDCGDEGPGIWRDSIASACVLVGTVTASLQPGVLVREFNAG
ncbi:hypothetical protein HUO13_11970 [Saccharopolyspora erythraea]|uniref:hypothetical protein n=1 Tax=Saccharopolyspora erythraea TaxID=1836 RepID=UPI001BAC8692|nr:hypothetical protein [Saccharopolyspora erythraea]QUH01431.1 hypothetical protein HUO13_11970 [Saccharopolyspora erythraea]